MKIGVDVGGSHVGIGIVNATGNLLLKKEKDYDKKQDDMSNIVLNTIIEIMKEIIQIILNLEEIESIGIAFPGTVY